MDFCSLASSFVSQHESPQQYSSSAIGRQCRALRWKKIHGGLQFSENTTLLFQLGTNRKFQSKAFNSRKILLAHCYSWKNERRWRATW